MSSIGKTPEHILMAYSLLATDTVAADTVAAAADTPVVGADAADTRFFWQQRRVPQRVIDGLAVLRSTAIRDILNEKVSTDAELNAWEAKEVGWQQKVFCFEGAFPGSRGFGL